MNWYLAALKKYAVFSGRARRKELWYFWLFGFIFGLILAFIDMVTGTWNTETGGGLLSNIFILVMILPNLAVSTRRLHDIGRTGWWILIMLIPLIGLIVLLIFYSQKGTQGENKHGPNPISAPE